MSDATTAPTVTPLMRQFQALKSQNPDALLFFRLGDFYELFSEDARMAAPILELVLTHRQGIPMCGLPHHALAGYLGKLLKRGHRVAIAEQMEDPSAAKGMVRREVVRVVTPGTILEDELLTAKRNNYLAAVWPGRSVSPWGLAWADMSTGEFFFTEAPDASRAQETLAAWDPREVLWPAGVPKWNTVVPVTFIDNALFLPDSAVRRAPDLFGVKTLEGYGLDLHHPALPAVAALLSYVERNQPAALRALRPPRRHNPAGHMTLDARTVRRLDLFPTEESASSTSLYELLDHTVTAMGGRRLKHWLLHPLMDPEAIHQRLDRVEFLLGAGRLRRSLSEGLKETADVERVLARLTAGTASGRDLNALRRTLRQAPALEQLLTETPALTDQGPLAEAARALHVPSGPRDLLERALAEDPPLRLSDGGVIREGYSTALDEWRSLARNGRAWMSDLERTEKEATGIASLKIGYTSVFGYYLEVSKSNLTKVPATWIRKQTLANAERYITPDLKTQEDKILGAEEKAKQLERELLGELRERLLTHRESLHRLAETLAEVDALVAFAEAAHRGAWTRPRLETDPVLLLESARHPVVERVLETGGQGPFVPNDLLLNSEHPLLLVTGPNMGGKSTYLRQTALIVILAQSGSFVPAKRATVGLVDRVFTRIGAGDNLAGGASTFLVEMQEVAEILHNATPRSLVILDEVGRGTSTYDGVAVAWAVAEHLVGPHAPAPRTLFATHYFELTELAQRFSRVKNAHAAVREWTTPDGKVDLVLLHEVRPGPAERSFGVHVAQMAGLPAACVERAKTLLAALESGEEKRLPIAPSAPSAQLDLFTTHPLVEKLRALNPEHLTPMEALSLLIEWRKNL